MDRPIFTSSLRDVDRALAHHVIRTQLVSSVNECTRMCFDTFCCVSFNFEYAASGMKTCELNKSTKGRIESFFVTKVGFVFYG